MNRIIRLRDGSSLDLVGLGVLAVVLATIVLAVSLIVPTVGMYRDPPVGTVGTRDSSAATQKHRDAVAWQREQVAGRSMFYKPHPPEYKEEMVAAKYYGGPTLLAYVNGTAWFSDGQKVSAKEPDGKSVHFVSATPPWSVRVRWEGGEFDVKLFDKTELSSLSSSSVTGVSWPSLATPAPAPAEPAAGGHRMGDPPSAGANVPPEARGGPGAGGGNGSPPPPPPPEGGAGGSNGGGGGGGGAAGGDTPGGPGHGPPQSPGGEPPASPPPAPPSGVPIVQPAPQTAPSPEPQHDPSPAPDSSTKALP